MGRPAENLPFVTIAIPCFNEERFIEHCVQAMCSQRFAGSLEFLFADGGSTDRTREILHALAERDPRIRVLDNPNRSVSSGLNVALRHARGRSSDISCVSFLEYF